MDEQSNLPPIAGFRLTDLTDSHSQTRSNANANANNFILRILLKNCSVNSRSLLVVGFPAVFKALNVQSEQFSLIVSSFSHSSTLKPKAGPCHIPVRHPLLILTHSREFSHYIFLEITSLGWFARIFLSTCEYSENGRLQNIGILFSLHCQCFPPADVSLVRQIGCLSYPP